MFKSLLTDLVKLERIEQENVGGIARPKITLVHSQILCLIQEGPGGLKMQGGLEFLQFDGTVWFDHGVDLRPRDTEAGQSDRITVLASKNDRIAAGTRFTIVHAQGSPGRAHHVEARIVRLPPAGGDG